MKKITLLLLFLTLSLSESFGQNVSEYIFNQSLEAYTPITGGTVLGNDATDDQRFYDPAQPLGGSNLTGVGFPIGFNFTFNGLVYDRFAINANGWICFGSSLLSPSVNMNTTSSYAPISSLSTAVPNELVARIAGLSRDLQSQSGGELRFELVGSAPNQTLIIQWKNFKKYNQVGDLYNFQIRLNQTTNSINVVFGSMINNAIGGLFQVGLRANPNAPNSNFSNRTTTTNWSTTAAGSSADNTMLLSSDVAPSIGLTYTWNPPGNCTGLPMPGNTISSVPTTCVNSNFNLSLQNPTLGSNVIYQWQASQDGAAYTAILGANSPTLMLSQSTATYYNCIVTCSASGETTTINPILVTISAPNQCYCIPTYTTGKTDGDLISNIQISGTSLANNSGTSPVNPSYTFFTGQSNLTANLQAGSTYNISVSVGTFSSQNIAVWIDYNDDGIFELSERVGFTTTSINGNATASFPISLVCNPSLGMHRMRIRDVYNISGSTIDPCANYGFGETEDYDITISTPAACPQPSALAANSVTSSGATLTWTIGCSETQWDINLALAGSGIPTGLPTNPNVSSGFSVTSLTPSTNYEFYVRANCDVNGFSLWSGPFSFTTLALPPTNDNCSNATQLVLGTVFADYAISATNNSATSEVLVTPGCANYLGGDVWFTVVVPASGKVTIETNPLVGSAIADTGIAAYSGACDTLLLIECDDNDSVMGNFSLISLTGRVPGEILYINAWENGNDEVGTFQIAAYDCTSTTPSPTGSTNQSFCSSATVGDLLVNGNEILWYDAAVGGNMVSVNDVLISGTTYFASQTLTCESFSRLQVTATISEPPTVTNADLQVCDDNADGLAVFNLTSANELITAQSSLNFTYFANIFDAESSSNTIVNPTSYITTTNPETVFVRVENEFGCYNIAELNLVVITTMAPTGLQNQSYCDGTVAFLQASGDSIQWYETAISTNSLSSATLLINGSTYYASQTANGCESSARLAVTYTNTCSVAGCTTDPNGQYPFVNYTPDCIGINEVITNVGYTGEYSIVNVTAGVVYTFSSSESADLITLSDGEGGTILATAIGNLVFTANASTAIRFYTHLNSSCDFSQQERSRIVRCGAIIPPPDNDDCSGAIALEVGTLFTDFPVVVANGGATASQNVADPDCSVYLGGDIWYSLIVPNSGTITIETATTNDSVTDTAIEVYSGSCSNLVAIGCNDDNPDNYFSILNLTGLNPGETILVRTFSFANDEIGTYQLAAYNTTLSNTNFNDIGFNYYPNPVNDVLNLSYSSLISKVQILNIIGQELKSIITSANAVQVDMSNLPVGTYLVKVTSENLVKTVKVVKQ